MSRPPRLAPSLVVGIGAAAVFASCALVGGLGDYYVVASDAGGGLSDARSGEDGANPSADGSVPPSCAGLAPTCGPSHASDCCASLGVPGGTFARSYDGIDGGGYDEPAFPATVSPFRLDAYEITVGRFRRFVAAYPGSKPAVHAGKNPHNPADEGWDEAWNASLPANAAALESSLACDAKATWTTSAGEGEADPINCVDWSLAFAFCIWDDGRLPTDAEWNFAAAGGSEQRVYPWSTPASSTTLTEANAVFDVPRPLPVGSRSPAGDGRWGHADLSGNVWEWIRDTADGYTNPCVDCGAGTGRTRDSRGGCFGCLHDDLRVAPRGSSPDTALRNDVGARCARSP